MKVGGFSNAHVTAYSPPAQGQVGKESVFSSPAPPSQPAQPRARHSLSGARASQPARIPAPPSKATQNGNHKTQKLKTKGMN